MTPAEKAQHLYLKYYGIPLYILTVKQCCHIAVDEIIKVACDESDYDESVTKSYWKQVKEEINKL